MILVHTLGTALIDAGSCPISRRRHESSRSCFTYAAERGRRVPRSMLQELIFPDQVDRNARHSLRELVYQLRQLGVPLDTGADGAELVAEHVCLDYDTIVQGGAITTEHVRAACGGFLPGYSPAHSEAYTEWYEGYRARSISALSRAFIKEVSRSRNCGDWGDNRTYGESLSRARSAQRGCDIRLGRDACVGRRQGKGGTVARRLRRGRGTNKCGPKDPSPATSSTNRTGAGGFASSRHSAFCRTIRRNGPRFVECSGKRLTVRQGSSWSRASLASARVAYYPSFARSSN